MKLIVVLVAFVLCGAGVFFVGTDRADGAPKCGERTEVLTIAKWSKNSKAHGHDEQQHRIIEVRGGCLRYRCVESHTVSSGSNGIGIGSGLACERIARGL